MKLRILSNIDRLDSTLTDSTPVQLDRYSARSNRLIHLARACGQLLRNDYALINCSPNDLFLLCFLRLLIPGRRCRIVSLDTVLPVPRAASFRDRAALWAKIVLFKQVHLFIEYFRDTRGYEHYYRIAKDKFRYVPFKVNRYERVLTTKTLDTGYIFCGGATRRDFRTLIDAVRGLPYPVRIVTLSDAQITRSGSRIDDQNLPPNVEVIRHDGSASFIDYIAAARLVVLPIVKNNISASGIGVYLASMALGKCVIISSGPAVDGVIPDECAIVVPPEDPARLRAAIIKAYADDTYRDHIAKKGQAYARSLGGEDRLYRDVMSVLVEDFNEHRN